ncbi:hypothetical protein L208DRAFT_1215426, partial [Tricholoma matsutake]
PPAFPPNPLLKNLSHSVITGFCEDTSPSVFQEAGCAVCGQLTQHRHLSKLNKIKKLLHVLHAEGATCQERTCLKDMIQDIPRPVLDSQCDNICDGCHKALRIGNVPSNALATGLCLGKVPPKLACLRYIEKLLIQRVWVNGCFVRVSSSGLRKLVSHVVAFESPVAKVY